jgi:hypothetical protein
MCDYMIENSVKYTITNSGNSAGFSKFQKKNEVQTYNQLLSIQIEIHIGFH